MRAGKISSAFCHETRIFAPRGVFLTFDPEKDNIIFLIMIPLFLIGGGWRAETFPQTYGRFLQNAIKDGQKRIALVVAEEPDADPHLQFRRFFEAFQAVGLSADEAAEIIVSAENPLTRERLSAVAPSGVFVCGGLTPAYYDALCRDPSWLEFLKENNIPYGGFSAGAAVAGNAAIIGGWRREVDGKTLEIANENAGEDLDLLDVRRGLSLAAFAVEVHATQWGTLSRLIHAVDAGLAPEGWAIDENTMLEVINGETKIRGAGNAYLVCRTDGKISVEIFQSAMKTAEFYD